MLVAEAKRADASAVGCILCGFPHIHMRSLTNAPRTCLLACFHSETFAYLHIRTNTINKIGGWC